MEAKKELILELHLKNFRNCEILRKLKKLNVNRRLIERTIASYRKTGSIKNIKRLGRSRTVRTKKLIKKVRERIRRNQHQTVRKLAVDLKVSKSLVHNVIKKDLGMKAYKKKKIHGLTIAQKKARVKKCDHLLSWHGDTEFIFSDEKLFVLQEHHNAQNDRLYAVSMDDIPIEKKIVERYQSASSVMVWGAISVRGKLPLVFIDKGVKINKEYYLEEVLKKHLLPDAKALFGDDYFCFQQDSAPAHKAKIIQKWLGDNLPDFLSVDEWPAASPDLNPLDYTIWSYMLTKLGNLKNINLETFKSRIAQVWDEIPDDVVRASCNAFFKRIKAVKKNGGERYELLPKK